MLARALAGLCPACLLAQGAETESGDAGGGSRFEPPSLDEVAKLFPQLEILDLLGAGGMGAVYKARQPVLDRFVALKILPAAGAGGVNFEERFNREARALARLSHPNIVAVHEFGQAGGLHYFLMEFVDGANLRLLEQGSRLSPREALQLIPQICDALQYAHDEGVVHRDIKPENVLVDRKGRVKIADFGLAKILGVDPKASRLTAEGQVMGTPHYMAPEQVERPLTVDHRADIYSLGVVLYEMLTCDLPLGKFSPPSRKVQVDVRFDEIVLRALENDPARRYQQVSEVKTQVVNIAGTPAPAVAPAAPVTDQRSIRWAGFPVVDERDGVRQVNWKETLKAWAIIFGLLSIGFAFVSAITGRSLMGWLGVVGWPSVVARFMIGGLLVASGLRRAIHRPWGRQLGVTAQGTVIHTPKTPWWRSRRVVVAEIVLVVVTWTLFQEMRLPSRTIQFIGNLNAKSAQVATYDADSGALVAKLPGGGSVELLALSDADSAPTDWWKPDGTPHATTTFAAENPGVVDGPDKIAKDMIFRFVNFPEAALSPIYEFNPSSDWSGGGNVRRNGQQLDHTWPIRAAWSESVHTVTLRLGVSLEPWRTIATGSADCRMTIGQPPKEGDPNWSVNFHQSSESEGQALLTVVRGHDDANWQTRIVAVDTNGVEHPETSRTGIPSETTATWTYTFRLPLAQIKEFRAQVRPLHWVEFRDVALHARGPRAP